MYYGLYNNIHINIILIGLFILVLWDAWRTKVLCNEGARMYVSVRDYRCCSIILPGTITSINTNAIDITLWIAKGALLTTVPAVAVYQKSACTGSKERRVDTYATPSLWRSIIVVDLATWSRFLFLVWFSAVWFCSVGRRRSKSFVDCVP